LKSPWGAQPLAGFSRWASRIPGLAQRGRRRAAPAVRQNRRFEPSGRGGGVFPVRQSARRPRIAAGNRRAIRPAPGPLSAPLGPLQGEPSGAGVLQRRLPGAVPESLGHPLEILPARLHE